MTLQELSERIRSRFPAADLREVFGVTNVTVEPGQVCDCLSFLKTDIGFHHMEYLTGIDRPTEGAFELIYELFCWTTADRVVVRTRIDRNKPSIPTVSRIFRTAEWHERETAELFGITFEGHADPRPLVLPDGFQGHPLRKDFSHPNLNPLPPVK